MMTARQHQLPRSTFDKNSQRQGQIERSSGGLHPAVDGQGLNERSRGGLPAVDGQGLGKGLMEGYTFQWMDKV